MNCEPKSENEKIYSFLMLGQSNMAGRGEFNEVEPICNPNCFVLRMGRWQIMSEPVNPDRGVLQGMFHSGVCLAESFADELSKHMNSKIGLIPCADGGTCLNQWLPNELLFDHAVMQARLAMRSSTLSGILWHQGESDCKDDESVCSYKKKFIKIITALRGELNMPNLPIIIGELYENLDKNVLDWSFEDRPKRLNRIFHEIENELPYCSVVSSKELSIKADGLHFDSLSLRTFGKRYFNSYAKMKKLKTS